MVYGFDTWFEDFAVVCITTIFSANPLIRRRLEFLIVRLIDSRRSWYVIKLTLICILQTLYQCGLLGVTWWLSIFKRSK